MDFEGVVFKVLAPVKGTSARGEWTKQEVVFELPGEFSRKVCVSFWGDNAAEAATLKEGEQLNVSINLESREYNGRWYTEARAWRLTKLQPKQNEAVPPIEESQFEPTVNSSEEPVDDLPF